MEQSTSESIFDICDKWGGKNASFCEKVLSSSSNVSGCFQTIARNPKKLMALLKLGSILNFYQNTAYIALCDPQRRAVLLALYENEKYGEIDEHLEEILKDEVLPSISKFEVEFDDIAELFLIMKYTKQNPGFDIKQTPVIHELCSLIHIGWAIALLYKPGDNFALDAITMNNLPVGQQKRFAIGQDRQNQLVDYQHLTELEQFKDCSSLSVMKYVIKTNEGLWNEILDFVLGEDTL